MMNKPIGQKIVTVELASLRPNVWNPNHMAAHKYESLKHGLNKHGWLISDALLVWGTDENKKTKNIIINGEHRWIAAQELGKSVGPALVLDGITEATARAWTIRLGNRGKFDAKLLDRLVAELHEEYATIEELLKNLALSEAEAIRAISTRAIVLDAPPVVAAEKAPAPIVNITSKNQHTHAIPLYMNNEQHAAYESYIRELGERYGIEVMTDIVREAVKRVVKRKSNAQAN